MKYSVYRHYFTDTLLSNSDLPKDVSACCDINCKNPQHGFELCSLHDSIVESVLASSRPLYKTKMYKAKPGWNEKLHAEARRAFKAWAESGRQKHSPLFE